MQWWSAAAWSVWPSPERCRWAGAGCCCWRLRARWGGGTQTSSRNSEVVHAGLYYPQESLKAQLCVSGREQLYDYCRAKGVPHRRLGKLLVASSSAQAEALAALRRRAEAAGVDDLKPLTPQQARGLEPLVRAQGGALLSPSSGILSVHALMNALLADAEASGRVSMLTRCRVTAGALLSDGRMQLEVRHEAGTRTTVRSAAVVNAAGLGAQDFASSWAGLPSPSLPPPQLHLARGVYFCWSASTPVPFSRLVYPLPPQGGLGGGLGVHATLDLAGGLRFGPDVEYVSHIDYRIDPERRVAFEAAIRDYFPALPDGALAPAYAGIRPKLSRAGEPPADFAVHGSIAHGVPGLVNMFGIESPGLTACLALADLVVQTLRNDGA